jgi:hypothetical protein
MVTLVHYFVFIAWVICPPPTSISSASRMNNNKRMTRLFSRKTSAHRVCHFRYGVRQLHLSRTFTNINHICSLVNYFSFFLKSSLLRGHIFTHVTLATKHSQHQFTYDSNLVPIIRSSRYSPFHLFAIHARPTSSSSILCPTGVPIHPHFHFILSPTYFYD